jgi:hypothetical protein
MDVLCGSRGHNCVFINMCRVSHIVSQLLLQLPGWQGHEACNSVDTCASGPGFDKQLWYASNLTFVSRHFAVACRCCRCKKAMTIDKYCWSLLLNGCVRTVLSNCYLRSGCGRGAPLSHCTAVCGAVVVLQSCVGLTSTQALTLLTVVINVQLILSWPDLHYTCTRTTPPKVLTRRGTHARCGNWYCARVVWVSFSSLALGLLVQD